MLRARLRDGKVQNVFPAVGAVESVQAIVLAATAASKSRVEIRYVMVEVS